MISYVEIETLNSKMRTSSLCSTISQVFLLSSSSCRLELSRIVLQPFILYVFSFETVLIAEELWRTEAAVQTQPENVLQTAEKLLENPVFDLCCRTPVGVRRFQNAVEHRDKGGDPLLHDIVHARSNE